MSFDFSKDGEVDISMHRFVDEIRSRASLPSDCWAASPAAENLFEVDDAQELLDDSEQEHMHSIVAMLLYLAKRIRPDLLTAVNFLSRRVNKFTAEDRNKMDRALKYLNATKEMTLTLRFGDGWCVVSSVDSAYGVTPDFRSTTGATTSLGRGSVHAQSQVQKLVTKSSCESETVAASDYGGTAIWTCGALRVQVPWHALCITVARPRYKYQGTPSAPHILWLSCFACLCHNYCNTISSTATQS